MGCSQVVRQGPLKPPCEGSSPSTPANKSQPKIYYGYFNDLNMNIFTNFLVRLGAPGGTARWAAKNYLRLKTPNKSDVEVMRDMVEIRYKFFKDEKIKKELLRRLTYLDNLTDFTFSILQLEKSLPEHLQIAITQVIIKELHKKGVSEKAIIGNAM